MPFQAFVFVGAYTFTYVITENHLFSAVVNID